MNSRRLLAILLVGMLLSACAQFTPYRTQTKAEEWPPQCAVDDALAKDLGLDPCESPGPHRFSAIQHRRYQASFEYKEDNQNKITPVAGDYYLSFVEFDDQGWFADRKQMEALFTHLEKLEKNNGHTLIYVYAHGWKHNASACDNNVVCFSRLLERTDLAERMMHSGKGENRTVVGVYLGWRGLPYKAGALTNLSFWTRKEAAARVGRGGVFELLVRLNDYRNSRQKEETDPLKTQLVITGHSFGGLVVYSALSHALMERAAKTTKDPNAVAKSFGDFVMLVNPAFEGSLYEPLFHIATNRCYKKSEQRPVMMIVTSEADSATGVAFPMGRTLSTLLDHAKSPDQADSIRKAIGHHPRYQTHNLIWKEPEEQEKPEEAEADKTEDKSECGCPYLEATSEFDLNVLVGNFREYIDFTFDMLSPTSDDPKKEKEPSAPYGKGVSLEPIRNKKEKTDPLQDSSQRYASSYPYLVVKTNADFIPDHNAIYRDRFINFAQSFFLYHIASPKPLPLPGDSDKCTKAPDCEEGGVVRCKQSCQLDDNGKSCSVPTQ